MPEPTARFIRAYYTLNRFGYALDRFGGRCLRVKGHAKMMSHLMCGILLLCADSIYGMRGWQMPYNRMIHQF